MRSVHVSRWVGTFLDDLEAPAFVLAPLLALLLAGATFLPIRFARTSWSYDTMGMIDSPSGYVAVLSLWGCIAFTALVIGIWRQRWAWLAMIVAAVGFAGASAVCIGYWLQLTRGLELVDGTTPVSDEWITHAPPALPLFTFAAIVGCVGAAALARGCWHARDQE